MRGLNVKVLQRMNFETGFFEAKGVFSGIQAGSLEISVLIACESNAVAAGLRRECSRNLYKGRTPCVRDTASECAGLCEDLSAVDYKNQNYSADKRRYLN